MEAKRIIEVTEQQRRELIGTLNEHRNTLVKDNRPTDMVDDALLLVIDAPPKKERRKQRDSQSHCR